MPTTQKSISDSPTPPQKRMGRSKKKVVAKKKSSDTATPKKVSTSAKEGISRTRKSLDAKEKAMAVMVQEFGGSVTAAQWNEGIAAIYSKPKTQKEFRARLFARDDYFVRQVTEHGRINRVKLAIEVRTRRKKSKLYTSVKSASSKMKVSEKRSGPKKKMMAKSSGARPLGEQPVIRRTEVKLELAEVQRERDHLIKEKAGSEKELLALEKEASGVKGKIAKLADRISTLFAAESRILKND